MTRIPVVVALAAALFVAGCATDPDAAPASDSATAPPSSTAPNATATPEQSTDPSASAAPTVSADPAPTPSAAPLAWEPAGRAGVETVTSGQGWTIVVDEERSLATLSGPKSRTVSGDKRFRVDEVMLDQGYAVVVLGDTLQQQPARATVVDLATGKTSTLDGRSDPPTVNGGTWALQGGRLVHASRDADGAYCLASRDLTAGPEAPGELTFCAKGRQGFTNARLTPTGLGLLTFDAARPSCRTVAFVGMDGFDPPPDQECRGWELAPTPSGPVWSVTPRPKALDETQVFATAADGAALDLGPATAGSLTWCAGATYFVRDPQTPGDPARLLRWTDAGSFEVVYETAGGEQAFLDGPRCGGDRVTLSAYAESGDQQVSAPVS